MEHQSESILEVAYDPLLRQAEFPHSGLYFPYGAPLRLRTNSLRILEAARQGWSVFTQLFDNPPIELHAGVAGASTGSVPPLPPVMRTQRHLFAVTGDAEHFGVCDFEAGFGYCWLSPRVLDDLDAVRYHFLDTLAFAMVAERYLTGVHGACVSWKGRGVLLCGESAAGKSTLAYACARRGFTFTSDDASFLVRAAQDRSVVGRPYSIRLRPSTEKLFPELEGFLVTQHPNRKPSIEVSTQDLGFAIAPRANADVLVFLNRQPGQGVRLLPFSKQAALARMRQTLHYGREESLREQHESLYRLLQADVYEMIYSDLDPAVDCLCELLEKGS